MQPHVNNILKVSTALVSQRLEPVIKACEIFDQALQNIDFLQTYALNLNIPIEDICKEINSRTIQVTPLTVEEYDQTMTRKELKWGKDYILMAGWVDDRPPRQENKLFINRLDQPFPHLQKGNSPESSQEERQESGQSCDEENLKYMKSGDSWECKNIRGRIGITYDLLPDQGYDNAIRVKALCLLSTEDSSKVLLDLQIFKYILESHDYPIPESVFPDTKTDVDPSDTVARVSGCGIGDFGKKRERNKEEWHALIFINRPADKMREKRKR